MVGHWAFVRAVRIEATDVATSSDASRVVMAYFVRFAER